MLAKSAILEEQSWGKGGGRRIITIEQNGRKSDGGASYQSGAKMPSNESWQVGKTKQRANEAGCKANQNAK
jgi:hypothetical protein